MINVPYTDSSKPSIQIADGTIDNSTSVSLLGNNVAGYGQAIDANFLHLLENFASLTPPDNPVEGQLWYFVPDPISNPYAHNTLMVFDSGDWVPASGVYQQNYEPNTAIIGNIWVDTDVHQLKIYNGVEWILVGPDTSGTLRTGAYSELISDSNDIMHYVIKHYIDGEIVSIESKEQFNPKLSIDGFTVLYPGINLSYSTFSSNILPKFNGIAYEAQGLRVSSPTSQFVSANSIVRTDIDQTVNGRFTINTDAGVRIGVNTSTFLLKKVGNDAVISNISDSSKILFNMLQGGDVKTVLALDSTGVEPCLGINTASPTETLDVVGSLKISKDTTLLNLSVTGTTTLSNGVTIDGATVINNTATVVDIIPSTSSVSLGSSSSRFNTLWVNNIVSSSTIYVGTATFAEQLSIAREISLKGHIRSIGVVSFDGSTSTVLNTVLTNKAIDTQTSITDAPGNYSIPITDSSSSIFKITKSNLLKDIIAPGVVMNWAGSTIPVGWVLCDGASYNVTGIYANLYSAIGTSYGSTGVGYFNVPTLSALTPVTGPAIQYIIKL